MTRMLVVEDDSQLLRALVSNLRARRYGVDAAPDGASALRLAAARQPDVVMFSMDELFARLRAAVRRTEESPLGTGVTLVETADFSIDLPARKVRRADREVRLTPTEWHLREILVTNPGRI
ncbi:two-component system KDP operon response regulator KdpE [Streptomyces sp. SAI-208]|nr:two-component system KDP operon response regulator KdpE [Streptomyces sp. SAI-208]